MCCSFHCINNIVIAVGTVFDPGGVVESLFVAMLGGTITLTSLLLVFYLVIVLVVKFSSEFAVTVFDPGGKFHFSCNHCQWNIVRIRCLLKVTTAALVLCFEHP
jgi:hypothetical protein